MTDIATTQGGSAHLRVTMKEIGRLARAASHRLALLASTDKDAALSAMRMRLEGGREAILAINARDCAEAELAGQSAALIDRLRITSLRFDEMTGALTAIRELDDPVGTIVVERRRPNGLVIQRRRVPIGVIAVIYESRPNVTVDAAALCLKSGNAVILRGGSESFETNRAIHRCLASGLADSGLTADAVQLVPTTDRDAVAMLLGGLDGAIDLVIPRGGADLIARVKRDARVPVLGHMQGNCHVYIDAAADPAMATAIAVNSKLRRTGICGAAETLLIDVAAEEGLARGVVCALLDGGCEVRGDAQVQLLDSRVRPASDADWTTEFLAPIIAAARVSGVTGAIEHVARHGSGHTESIVTEDLDAAERFLAEVDSAIVLHNASTQFADGGEFGMGAEIGISTDRLHARGPVGVEELTTYKYVVRGSGQTRR
ncbi:MAG: glutamate-5-semialdehyde dehydrogenase [Gammaproteobacteria bacterium]|nr:glutamate-5-semialdehyde dehydrogenase [Gammaproteobacteria bacterium]